MYLPARDERVWKRWNQVNIDNYCVAHDYLYIGFFFIKDIIVDTFASSVLHIKEINVDSEIRMSWQIILLRI